MFTLSTNVESFCPILFSGQFRLDSTKPCIQTNTAKMSNFTDIANQKSLYHIIIKKFILGCGCLPMHPHKHQALTVIHQL